MARPARVLALLIFLVAARHARADGTAAASETARALFNEGLALRARGDLAGAIGKLRAAHALRATPVTAYELAKTHAENHELVEARDLLLSIRRLPAGPNESRDAALARSDANALAEDLKRRIPSLTIALSGPGAAAHPMVLIDDVAIPPEALPEPQRLNPTRHHIVARVQGAKEVTTDVELHEAEKAQVVLDVPSTPTTQPPTQPDVDRRSTVLPKVVTYGGFSLAFAGAVVGTFAGLRSIDQVSALKSACNTHRICSPDQTDAIDSAKTSGNVATTAFIVSGVGVALGVAGLLLWPRGERVTSASLVLGPGAVGVRGAF